MPDQQPGQSASAVQEKVDAEALERHRMRSNAFYQQDSIRRNVTPSNKDHPACRHEHDDNKPISSKSAETADFRSSQVTTLSPFVHDGKENMRMHSPQRGEQLKLVPDDQENAIPTSRGIIEDRREQMVWDSSGQKDDRTPVYIHSPRPADAGLNSNGSSNSSQRARSPKKKLLDRFNFSRTKSAPKVDIVQPLAPTNGIAPKAAAILGTSVTSAKKPVSTPNSSLSKRIEVLHNLTDHNKTSSPNSSVPDTAFRVHRKSASTYSTPLSRSDISRYEKADLAGRRVVSQPDGSPEREAEKAAQASSIARSKSLHYWDDRTVPPTPPTKDTPPELKQKPSSVDGSTSITQPRTPLHHHHRRTHTFADETPSKLQTALFDTEKSQRKPHGGGYVSKSQIRITENDISVEATQAVLVTDNSRIVTDRDEIIDAEAVTYVSQGLTPDGRLPPTVYSPSPPAYKFRHVYSPSIYQEDFEGQDKNAAEDDGDGRKSITQSKRHSSPLVGSFRTDYSPVQHAQSPPSRSRHSNKSVTFEPRHISYHYDPLALTPTVPHNSPDSTAVTAGPSGSRSAHHRRTASADSQLQTTPSRKGISGARVKVSNDQDVAKRSKSPASNSSSGSSSLGFITTLMNAKQPASAEDSARTFRKLNKIFGMKPDLSPNIYSGTGAVCGRVDSMDEYETRSAMPSPLHYRGPNWENNNGLFDGQNSERIEDDEDTVTGLGLDVCGSDTRESMRLVSSSTLGAGDGHSTGSELSLRDRFTSASASNSTSPLDPTASGAEHGVNGVHNRLDQLSSRFRYLTSDFVKKDTEMSEVKTVLVRIVEGMERVESTCHTAVSKLSTMEQAMISQDDMFEKCIDDLTFTTTRIANTADNIESTVSVLTEEFVDFEEKASATAAKVDAIEFQVNKFDSLAQDMSALTLTCQKLDGKLESLAQAVDAGITQGMADRMQKLEQGLRVQSNLLERLGSLEQKVKLGERVISFGNRLAALEQKIGGSEDGIPGTGLWKRRGTLAADSGSGNGLGTPPTSAGSSASGGLGLGLWMGGMSPAARSPGPRR